MKNLHAVLALCSAKVINDAIVAYLFPFIAELLLRIGVDKHGVSRYSGMAEGIMSLVNVLTIPLWANLLDHYSHRNLLLLSLRLSCIVSTLFGWAFSLWQILFLRGFLGAVEKMGLLGNVMMSEITAEEDRARAFGWNGTATFLGEALGVWIGGYFAIPSGRVPILGRLKLFEVYPFVLPSLVISFLCIGVLVAILLYIPKSSSPPLSIDPEDENQPLIQTVPSSTEIDVSDFGYAQLARDKVYLHLLATNFFHKMSYYGTLALISTAGHLPTMIGGIGLSVNDLGRLLTLTQIGSVLYLMFLYPILFRNFSNRSIMIFASLGWITSTAFFPFANRIFDSQDPSSLTKLSILGVYVLGRTVGVTIYPTAQVLRSSLYPTGPGANKAVAVFGIATQMSNVIGASLYGWLFGLSSQAMPDSVGRWISPSVFIMISTICLARVVSRRDHFHHMSKWELTCCKLREIYALY